MRACHHLFSDGSAIRDNGVGRIVAKPYKLTQAGVVRSYAGLGGLSAVRRELKHSSAPYCYGWYRVEGGHCKNGSPSP